MASDALFLDGLWQSRLSASGSRGWWNVPRFATQNLALAQSHLRAYDRNADLTVTDPRTFQSYRESFIQLESLALSVSSVQSPRGYDLCFRPRDEYCLNIPLKGHGWMANGPRYIEMGTDQAAFVSPACEVRKHWCGSSQVLTVHIPFGLFSAAHRSKPLATLPGVVGISRDRLRSLLGLLDLVCREANFSDAPMLRAPAARHIEEAILSLLFDALPFEAIAPESTCSAGAGPHYIGEAEQYIRANSQVDLSLDAIAAVVGVSRRSLQYGFKQHRGASPMAFVRNLRLDRARRMLLSREGCSRTINEIAADVGYANPSQFARLYRAKFGECPSDTQVRRFTVAPPA